MERKPNDLDVFELNRGELNVLLSLLAKQPYVDVSEAMRVLTTRPPSRVVATEEEIAAAKAAEDAREVNPEAAADISEASAPSEEEMGTEQ